MKTTQVLTTLTSHSIAKLVRSLTFISLWTLALPACAFILDNFDSGKNGWNDTLNGGTVGVASGQMTITSATGNNALTASIKTAFPTTPALGTSFPLVAGHTLELRVEANSPFNASADTNALAILAWVPTGGSVLGNGYSLTIGADEIRIQKAGAVLYSTTGLGFNRTNLILVLRMTPSAGTVSL